MPLLVAAAFLGLALALAIIYLARGTTAPASWTKTLVKTLSVAALVPVGLALGAPFWFVAGLALGAIGDGLLSRPSEHAFLAGMAAFVAGHLAYVAAFQTLGAAWPPAIPLVVFLLLALSTELWLAPHTGALRWPVRGYVLVITAMGLAAFALPPGYEIARLGVLAFVLSDLILALDLFVLPDRTRLRPPLQRLLWALYWTGQALILAGLLPDVPL